MSGAGGQYPRPDPLPPHPAIAELFKLLPKPGEEWPLTERAKWLVALCGVLSLVYKTGESADHLPQGIEVRIVDMKGDGSVTR